MQFDEAFNSIVSFLDFIKNKDKGQCLNFAIFDFQHFIFNNIYSNT